MVEKRKTISKKLSVMFNIKQIAKDTKKKPARMTLEFNYAPYLKCNTDLANDLIDKLMTQLMSDKIIVMDLCLAWFEEEI